MIERVIITDALLEHDGELLLHPALVAWQQRLLGMQQQWLKHADVHTPWSWFSEQIGASPSSLLASFADDLPQHRQLWIASPYHARLTRAELRVMPESMLDWAENEAQRMCEVLNPLLADEGLSLHTVGCAMLLACDRPWQVSPLDFARISGKLLPNRSPEGEDAAKWMQLQTEIQMTLHQNPVRTAQGYDIHGVWFSYPDETVCKPHWENVDPVATHNAYLKSVLQAVDKERDACMIVTEAEQLSLLLKEEMVIPKAWLLLGEGKGVKLKKSLFHQALNHVRPQTWKG